MKFLVSNRAMDVEEGGHGKGLEMTFPPNEMEWKGLGGSES